ncbi:hypothetical protein ACIRG5_21675 [Lentzea sp. NPDC102401]|uniref:hypothetical protein n=1 Tax=Lentzea sp. NPDC102401 TaxID=3364128 RepID=UPI00382772F7
MDKFWESLGGKLAERWLSVAAPALMFWLGGLLMWMIGRGGPAALRQPLTDLAKLPVGSQLIGLVVVLLGVAASGWIVTQLVNPVLRFLQGYGPLWRPVRTRLVKRAQTKFDEIGSEFAALAPAVLLTPDSATPQQRAAYVRLTRRQRRLPGPGRFMPTAIGNTLRAAESHPIDKYGLDVVTVWPHLWLLLPDVVRTEVAAARARLNAGVAAGIWGVLFTGFAPWSVWAVPTGLITMIGCYLVWLPGRTEAYADLVQSAIDLYRRALYEQLRWPMPGNPAEERASGRLLSSYLSRGLSGSTPTFVASSSE